MSRNFRDDPTVQMIRKAQANDLRPRSTVQTDAEVAIPRLRGTIDELDENAAIVVFTLSPNAINGGRVDLARSMGYFRNMQLLWPNGAVAGQITAVAMDGSFIVCTADLNNTQVVADLASGAFNAVEVLCQTMTRRSDSTAPAGSVRPLSIRLVATTSSVNNEMNASKFFHVRRADGRLVKQAFAAKPHMGTGTGSGLNAQLSAFKKIHAGGGAPLDPEQLMKLSQPGTAKPADVSLDDTGRALRKVHRKGGRRLV